MESTLQYLKEEAILIHISNSYYYLRNKNGKEKDDRRWVFGTVIKATFETPAFHI